MESIYRDKRWYELQCIKEKGVPGRYYFQCPEGEVEYQFVKRFAGKVDQTEYYDIVTSRGMGGPYVQCRMEDESEFIRKQQVHFEQYCQEENIIAEYIKFDPWVHNERHFKEHYEIEHYGNTYCNHLSEDFYHQQYHTSVRARIRSALEKGVSVVFDQFGNSIPHFLDLYRYTDNKYQVSDFYKLDEAFIRAYFEKLQGKVVIAYAMWNGIPISAVLMLLGKDIAHYHFLGNDPDYRKLQANTLLIHQCISYAKERGKSLFDHGSSVLGSGVETFKKNFVRKENCYPYYIGKKIRNQLIYDTLVERAGKIRDGYFPAYRG